VIVANALDAPSIVELLPEECQLLEPGKKTYARIEDLHSNLREARRALANCGF
jgi:hypothetical protein